MTLLLERNYFLAKQIKLSLESSSMTYATKLAYCMLLYVT